MNDKRRKRSSVWQENAKFAVIDGDKKSKRDYRKLKNVLFVAVLLLMLSAFASDLEEAAIYIWSYVEKSDVAIAAAIIILLGPPIYFLVKSKGKIFIKKRNYRSALESRFFLFAALDDAIDFRKRRPFWGTVSLLIVCLTIFYYFGGLALLIYLLAPLADIFGN
tara:strand:- start:3871 stop:4362 length:492 start_codon:yes stop_codon:yes gene_type:complete